MYCLVRTKCKARSVVLMPHYEYRCKKCSTYLIMKQDFNDETVPNCPTCQALMSKMYTATPAIFRGTGWAKNG